MRVQLLRSAEIDLETGYWFYEAQAPGVGDYFLASLRADLLSLNVFAGIHPQPFNGVHRALAKRFPYAIYYLREHDCAIVLAILDGRRDPQATIRALPGRLDDAS